jgi:hypothetical protein
MKQAELSPWGTPDRNKKTLKETVKLSIYKPELSWKTEQRKSW